jgi:hypothetical protein
VSGRVALRALVLLVAAAAFVTILTLWAAFSAGPTPEPSPTGTTPPRVLP